MKQKTEKISNDEKVTLMFDLINSFKNLKDLTEIANFLQDLLTANEIKNLSVRLRIAKLLIAGKSQREIVLATHSSLGTVNKVNIWLEKGGEGSNVSAPVVKDIFTWYFSPDKNKLKNFESFAIASESAKILGE